MSKMDELRALREARYSGKTAAAKPAAAPKKTSQPARKPAEAQTPADAKPGDTPLCGHRAISGRTCTREQGHSAKSHRYS